MKYVSLLLDKSREAEIAPALTRYFNKVSKDMKYEIDVKSLSLKENKIWVSAILGNPKGNVTKEDLKQAKEKLFSKKVEEGLRTSVKNIVPVKKIETGRSPVGHLNIQITLN